MPGAKPDNVLVVVVPAIAPGFRVQFPAGKPVSVMLPVATRHEGWVIVPATGAVGVTG